MQHVEGCEGGVQGAVRGGDGFRGGVDLQGEEGECFVHCGGGGRRRRGKAKGGGGGTS